jgi:hypothetical protein
MTAERCPPSSLNHVTVDTLWFFWNADNGGALKCALRDIAKSHVKLKSITRVTIEYCHEQDFVFIFIQSVPGVSVYTECCSVATRKTICSGIYRLFHNCRRCRQNVAILPQARIWIYVHTECSTIVIHIQRVAVLPRTRLCLILYRVFQDGHAYTEFRSVSTSKIVFIQSVSGVSIYTKCWSVAMSKTICWSIYKQCSRITSLVIVVQHGHEQEYVFMYIQSVPRIPCIHRVLRGVLLVPWARLFWYVRFVSFLT